jgi:hypothetical protein
MVGVRISRVAAVFALLPLCAQEAPLPAFPGAEGFGATTPGGRGGAVLFVTNLDDSGPGSLRAAIAAKGPRTILFRVGGLIDLRSSLVVREPFLTLAGESAPGGGVCLRGQSFVVAASDVIVRHLRARLGDLNRIEGDAVSITAPARRVILDHVSASWSVDETLSPSGDIADVTVQWSLIAESLYRSVHSKGPHGYGTLARATGGLSLHHNIWAHHNGRNPRLGDNYAEGDAPVIDVRHNLIYNWGSYCTGVVDGHIRVNYVGNFLRFGPSSNRNRAPIYIGDDATEETRFHVFQNVVDGRDDYTSDNARLFTRIESGGKRYVTLHAEPFAAPPVTPIHPNDLLPALLAWAGATRPRRDAVDERIVSHIETWSGRLVDSQAEVGGWPEYASGPAPVDSDEDGLPDEWELARGLDPANPLDSRRLSPSGYSFLELYLHELAAPPR